MNEYLSWMSNATKSVWWNDSADFVELDAALESGAIGVTTNPVLVCKALYDSPEFWKPYLADMDRSLTGAKKTEELIRRVTVAVAEKFLPKYTEGGTAGYVCAQVDPTKAGDRETMLAMARRLHSWAPNIAVKLPATAAGLDVLEECAAEGITVTATVSFTVPQVLAVGDRYQKGLERCRKAGKKESKCFAVVMVGRIDDYIRDTVHDSNLSHVLESDIIQAGSAIMKRAIAIFAERKYEAIMMPAGMRGAYHVTDLAGADITMSIHPKIQKLLEKVEKPYTEHHLIPVDPEAIKRLMTVREFVRAYETDVMPPEEFITFGVVQKTLAQFTENWNAIGAFTV
jgi:transaldolase